MADVAPAPRHPAPTAVDANPYAPYAVLAVIALIVAIVYAVVLTVRAFMAFRNGQPLIEQFMLVFPLATLILAFAARRQILNSEGARAGLPLVNTAWWIAVLGGFGYLSYLVAYQLGVRQDSANTFRAWAKNLNDLDYNDPRNPSFFYLLDGTLEPDQQGLIKVGNADLLMRQQKARAAAVRQAFLVRLANRNRGALDISVGGLDNWQIDPNGSQRGMLGVTVKCPEGEFGFNLPMQARRIGGQWKWQIGVTQTANLTSVRVTRYGQLIRDMEQAGFSLVNDAFVPAVAGLAQNPALFKIFGEQPSAYYPVRAMVEGRMAVAGGAGWQYPEPANYNDLIGKHFEPVEKGDPVREAEQRRGFIAAWRLGRLAHSGRFLRQNVDPQPILTIEKGQTEEGAREWFELRVPVEIQPPGSEMMMNAARAVVVLKCTDEAFLARASELRAAAAGDVPTTPSTDLPAPGSIPWRFARIESDMRPVALERDTVPPGPPPQPGE